MQIQVNLHLTTFPEIEAIEPKISTIRIYNTNSWKNDEPKELNEWHNELFAKTIEGVDGSYHGYITIVHDYFGRTLYTIARLVPQDV